MYRMFRKVKERTKTEPTKISKIFDSEWSNSCKNGICNDSETAKHSIVYNNIKAGLYRLRQKELAMPNTPTTRADIILPIEYQVCNDSEKNGDAKRFLLFQTEGKDKMIAFGSDVGIRIMKNCDWMGVDGTFKVATKLFYQLYIFQCEFRNMMFPCVFVLLHNKTETTYVTMLSNLIRCVGQFNPTTIMVLIFPIYLKV